MITYFLVGTIFGCGLGVVFSQKISWKVSTFIADHSVNIDKQTPEAIYTLPDGRMIYRIYVRNDKAERMDYIYYTGEYPLLSGQ